MESSALPHPPTSETTALPVAGYYLEEELVEEEESLTARAEVEYSTLG